MLLLGWSTVQQILPAASDLVGLIGLTSRLRCGQAESNALACTSSASAHPEALQNPFSWKTCVHPGCTREEEEFRARQLNSSAALVAEILEVGKRNGAFFEGLWAT